MSTQNIYLIKNTIRKVIVWNRYFQKNDRIKSTVLELIDDMEQNSPKI